jgi:hypothetical protein
MSWLTSPAFIVPASIATFFLIGLTAQRRFVRTKLLAALMLASSVTALACLALRTDTTAAAVPRPPLSGAQTSGSTESTDAGVPDPLNPGCSDPKTCGEPRPPGQPQPHPLGSSDAGVPGPLNPGCSDPKTCGEPRPPGQPQPRPLSSSDAGVPDPLDPGCSDPKTCGEPRPPLRPTGLDGGAP